MSDPTSLSPAGDRHFDGLADKFAGSLYGGPRGALRLALLDRLLPEMLALDGQPMLDVGGGLGQLAAWFARRGHAVTLLEPARDMLERARLELEGLPVRYVEASLQDLPSRAAGPWPLITCHAVLEWMHDPRTALNILAGRLAPGGQLSLMVFNRDALRFSNVVKGNLQKALDDRLEGTGKRQRLTPISPLSHEWIVAWSRECGLSLQAVAGIRVFHDYLRQPPASEADWERLVALEQRYCRSEPHWRLGRYLLYTFVAGEAASPAKEEPVR
ncbi:methyltransferase domain-containing protein [Billgrantia saliphila]|uniref:methyltransferase domain-containing protein n=1 Tax=Billgrantia saliphila TaxID=1848458 RepID=UPI000CE41D30|nr:methyltransferase domain-containing protein [Halomonas saliphila]